MLHSDVVGVVIVGSGGVVDESDVITCYGVVIVIGSVRLDSSSDKMV